MVQLIITQAPLLPGSLRQCAAEDPPDGATPDEEPTDFQKFSSAASPCASGGLPAVNALNRFYQRKGEADDGEGTLPSSLIVPLADFKDPLTIMSRFGFGVNTMIFQELGFKTWTLPAYTLWPDRLEEATVYNLQEPGLPAVISNVATSPVEAAHPYLESIYFDSDSKLAILYLTKEYLSNTHSQVQTVQRLLQFIYKRNRSMGCNPSGQEAITAGFTVPPSGASAFSSSNSFSEWFAADPSQNNATSFPTLQHDPEQCYLPVVVFDDKDQAQYDIFITSLQASHQEYMGDEGDPTLRPHIVLDLYGHALSGDGETTSVRPLSFGPEDDTDSSTITPTTKTWIVSYQASRSMYHHLDITIADDRSHVEAVNVVEHSLDDDLPQEITESDAEYRQDLFRVRQYAREAVYHSQTTEAGVLTRGMPEMTKTADGFRQCYVGECEVGNLMADALRWAEQSDVSLVPSFMFDGPGWGEGEIRTLELLENIPYTAPRCFATLNGNSLLRLVQHSIATASFGPYDSAKKGGRLLQVSGLRFVFNNELDPESGNIASLDVWDKDEKTYLPLNRTRLYSLASCNHLCFTFTEFPELLGPLLVEEGEVAAEVRPETEIKSDVLDYLVENFYDAGKIYEPVLEGRIVADSSVSEALFVEEAQNCADGVTFWDTSILKCSPCPIYDRVIFSETQAELTGVVQNPSLLYHEFSLTNNGDFAVNVTPETLTLPENIKLAAVELPLTGETPLDRSTNLTSSIGEDLFVLFPNEMVKFKMSYDPAERSAGIDTSSLVFLVQGHSRSGLCQEDFKMKYDVVAKIAPSKDVNDLGGVAAFGFTASGVIMLMSIGLAAWVHWRRKTRAVAAMQPFFLMTLCAGILLIGSSLIPWSIDDGFASQRGCDMACTARPWLLFNGFAISISAMYSKLSRINKLFRSKRFRRIKVKEQDVIAPPLVMISLDIIFLLVWTIADPPRWERVGVPQEPWKTYGYCNWTGSATSRAMAISILVLCTISFCFTVGQAFKARNISSEFSESKHLGVAVFSWVQLLVVGVPVMFLVEEHNVVAQYSIIVGILVAICLSMLLVIFVPLITHREGERRSRVLMYGSSQFDRHGRFEDSEDIASKLASSQKGGGDATTQRESSHPSHALPPNDSRRVESSITYDGGSGSFRRSSEFFMRMMPRISSSKSSSQNQIASSRESSTLYGRPETVDEARPSTPPDRSQTVESDLTRDLNGDSLSTNSASKEFTLAAGLMNNAHPSKNAEDLQEQLASKLCSSSTESSLPDATESTNLGSMEASVITKVPEETTDIIDV